MIAGSHQVACMTGTTEPLFRRLTAQERLGKKLSKEVLAAIGRATEKQRVRQPILLPVALQKLPLGSMPWEQLNQRDSPSEASNASTIFPIWA